LAITNEASDPEMASERGFIRLEFVPTPRA
jgi:hypothetical protein